MQLPYPGGLLGAAACALVRKSQGLINACLVLTRQVAVDQRWRSQRMYALQPFAVRVAAHGRSGCMRVELALAGRVLR